MLQGLNLKDWITIFTSIVAITVVPFTLLGIWRSKIISHEADNWKSRQEEIGTYNEINIRYIEFLRFLAQNSDVDIGEFNTPRPLSEQSDIYKRNLMYAMLVAMMERAYLLYTEIEAFNKKIREYKAGKTWIVKLFDAMEKALFGKPPPQYETHIFITQWPGWEKYFRHYCGHSAFQEYWNMALVSEKKDEVTQWHDTDFEKYVNRLIEELKTTQLD